MTKTTLRIPKTLKIGERLNTGSFKDCFVLTSHKNLVALVPIESEDPYLGEVKTELYVLKKLDKLGIPTPKRSGLFKHTIRNKPTKMFLMERHPIHNRERGYPSLTSRYLAAKFKEHKINPRTVLKDIDKLLALIKRKRVAIQDFQFLISKGGKILITDPQEVRVISKTCWNDYVYYDEDGVFETIERTLKAVKSTERSLCPKRKAAKNGKRKRRI